MRGALTQVHVVVAVLLRETKTRFGDNQLGYLWAFLEQGLMVGMFAAFFSLFGRLAPPGMVAQEKGNSLERQDLSGSGCYRGIDQIRQ